MDSGIKVHPWAPLSLPTPKYFQSVFRIWTCSYIYASSECSWSCAIVSSDPVVFVPYCHAMSSERQSFTCSFQYETCTFIFVPTVLLLSLICQTCSQIFLYLSIPLSGSESERELCVFTACGAFQLETWPICRHGQQRKVFHGFS